MRRLRSLLRRMRSLFTREASNIALSEELEFHLEQATADNMARGMSREVARAAARQSFGSVAEAIESCYEARGVAWLEDLGHDIRYGLRTFANHRSFTILTVFTLALGIGACSAIFSLFNTVLLRSLPYGNPERLVYLFTPNPRYHLPPDIIGPSKADFFDLKNHSRSYTDMTMFEQATYNLSTGEQTQQVGVAKVDADFFKTLEVKPLFGRVVDSADLEPGKDRVVVIGYSLWQSLFAGASDVLRKPVLLDGASYRVVGVMPPEFAYPHRSDMSAANGRIDRTDLWIPLALTPQQRAQREGSWGYVMGRLNRGVTIPEAQAEMSAIMSTLSRLHATYDRGWGAYVKSFRESALGPVRPLMWLLLGAVGLVLMIACVNAANLLLARAADRAHELGVRATLGAGRARLLRQMLTESLMLSAAAGGLGAGLAWLFLHGLLRLNPGDIPGMMEATIDVRVLGFLAAVTMLTSLLFGVLPSFTATRIHLAEFLHSSGMRGVMGDRRRTRRTLAIAQVALVVVLLTGAGLLLRSYAKVLSAPMGFSPSTVTASVLFSPEIAVLPQNPLFKTAAKRRQFLEDVLSRFSHIPGVQAAGAVDVLPLSHWEVITLFEAEGYPNEKGQTVELRRVTPRYFSAMEIPLVRGRGFTDDDGPGRPRAVVVNEALARKYFGTIDAVGHRVRQSAQDGWETVTGVVGDVRNMSREAAAVPQMYLSFWQGDLDDAPVNGADFTVRSALPADAVIRQMRAVMRNVDPNLALADVRTMSDLESQAAARRRFQATLLAVFSTMAMLLALIGVYGLLTFSVQQRIGEIGIRMALGATRSGVVNLVMREGLTLLAAGLGIGLAAAAGLSRLLTGFLYQVAPIDALTYTLVALLLFVATIMACLVPSARAAGIDPMSALRHE
jgi:predicted permease